MSSATQSKISTSPQGEEFALPEASDYAAEYARVMRTVSEVDFDLYLHTV